MRSLHVRSLRVQVLLWTILPLIIVLLILSFTGIGSHQTSMRKVVAEENKRLIEVASIAIAARLDDYSSQIESLVAAQTASSARQEHGIVGQISYWRVDRQGLTADKTPAPAWVSRALAARPSSVSDAKPWLWSDVDSAQIVWVGADPQEPGWLVGGVPHTALALDKLLHSPHPEAAAIVAMADVQGNVIHASGSLPMSASISDWPGVGAAFAGTSGVSFAQSGDEDSIIAYGAIAGTPWELVFREPLADLVVPLFHFEQVLPLILVAAATVSFLTLYFGLNLVVRPLRALAIQAGRIGQGEFDAASQPVGGVDEIEDLRQALDVMAKRIQADHEALQSYVAAVTNAQEEERSRLARELHDDTVQTLIALDHKAQMVQRGLDKNPERTREQTAELRTMIAGAAQEVRRLSQALRPLYLEEVGLGPAVEMLARDAGAEYQLIGTQCRLGADKELALFRIAQESLSNARRHAQAQTTRVMLAFGPATVTLGAGDDGVGFQRPAKLSDLTQNGHLGLMGISERTQLVGGCLFLESQPGSGTVLMAQVPYDEHGALIVDNAQVEVVRSWILGLPVAL